MAMFMDVRSEDLIFLGSPRTLLQSHLFTTRSSHHLVLMEDDEEIDGVVE